MESGCGYSEPTATSQLVTGSQESQYSDKFKSYEAHTPLLFELNKDLLNSQYLIASDEIQSLNGPGKPLEFVCMGRLGVVFKGVYQVCHCQCEIKCLEDILLMMCFCFPSLPSSLFVSPG